MDQVREALRRDSALGEDVAYFLPGGALEWLASLVFREARGLANQHDRLLPYRNHDRARFDTLLARPLIDELLGKDAFALAALAKDGVELFEWIQLCFRDGE